PTPDRKTVPGLTASESACGAGEAPADQLFAPEVESLRAATSTAAVTAGATRGSSGEGMMRSGRSSSATTAAMARAAASFIDLVMRVAPAFSAPLKMPGNASTLLIWFG